jgi:hypothetical protein
VRVDDVEGSRWGQCFQPVEVSLGLWHRHQGQVEGFQFAIANGGDSVGASHGLSLSEGADVENNYRGCEDAHQCEGVGDEVPRCHGFRPPQSSVEPQSKRLERM